MRVILADFLDDSQSGDACLIKFISGKVINSLSQTLCDIKTSLEPNLNQMESLGS